MAVTTLEIKSRSPFGKGKTFGSGGTYEQLEGTVRFAVDPEDPANGGITDLALAQRDASGLVHFSADFRILHPKEPQQGNRRLLFDVVNRGRTRALAYFNRAADLAPNEPPDPGDGFLMQCGYTLVWCGWQHDVPDAPGLMRINVPGAMTADGPVSGRLSFSFQPNAMAQVQMLADRMHRPYPANNLSDPDAILMVQDHAEAPLQVIPRGQWSFARLENGQVMPDPTHIYLASGFQPGKIYQVIYSTTGAPVIGLGFLATRDLVSFLRYGASQGGNPCAGRIERAYAFGASQSGGYLRQFLYLAANQDEMDRTVFDGVISHIAGGRSRWDLNQRFGQPSDALSGSGGLFPFPDMEQTDPETGLTDGLLSKLAARGKLPKVFFTNSSAEYWRGHAALIHTDVSGNQDIAPGDSVRIYHFAGTQHSPGSLPLTDGGGANGSRGQQLLNCVDYRPLLKALLAGLDRWVTTGEIPPASRHPRIDDGTAVLPEQLAGTYRSIPGVEFPQHLRRLRRLDYGAENGVITKLPPEPGKPYPNLVSAVDQDGNELAGIRLPDLRVPLATHTGWNLRHPDTGGLGQTIGLSGSTIPFPASVRDRQESGDPRLSTEERYSSKEDYLELVRKAAHTLAEEGYLLAEDIDTVVQDASERYNALSRGARELQTASTTAGLCPRAGEIAS
jgi:hypothetical protein